MATSSIPSCLLVEPFYGGSHKLLIDHLAIEFNVPSINIFTLPAKKWHWKIRTSSLVIAELVNHAKHTEGITSCFISAVVNLAELVALCPIISKNRKILYFHENQLVYPVRKHQDRDFQHGYAQIVSCLAADFVVFNSFYNMESFLSKIVSFLNISPSEKCENVLDKIKPKCRVLYLPLFLCPKFISSNLKLYNTLQNNVHIVWPHRWEHDKNPDSFLKIMSQLYEDDLHFKLSILGEQNEDIPTNFTTMYETMKNRIVHWGYVESREVYLNILKEADIVVSTAHHEFFGISMLEAAFLGCYPLCPNRLVYPEIYPQECIYNTENQLYKRLKTYCGKPHLLVRDRSNLTIDFSKYFWSNLSEDYRKLLF